MSSSETFDVGQSLLRPQFQSWSAPKHTGTGGAGLRNIRHVACVREWSVGICARASVSCVCVRMHRTPVPTLSHTGQSPPAAVVAAVCSARLCMYVAWP